MVLLDVMKIADLPREEFTPLMCQVLRWANETGWADYSDNCATGSSEDLFNVTRIENILLPVSKVKHLVTPELNERLMEIKQICEENDCCYFRFITP